MRTHFAWIALLLGTSQASADPALAEKLRSVVRMPTWREPTLAASRHDGLSLHREQPALDRQQEADQLARLSGGPDDIDALTGLASVARHCGRPAQSDGYLRMALFLTRERRDQEPDVPAWTIRLADTLALLGHFEESEAWFEHARRMAPRDPFLWRMWGGALWGRCCLITERILPVGSAGTVSQHAAQLRSAQIPEATRAELRHLAERARDCLDVAVLLAPNDPKALHDRMLFVAHRAVFESALSDTFQPAETFTQMRDDAERWMRLEPDRPRVIATAAWLEIDVAPVAAKPDQPRWEQLPADVQRSVRAKLERLETLAESLDLERTFEANLMLGLLHLWELEQPQIAATYLRKAFAMRPDHPSTGILLCGALADCGRWEAVVGIAELALRQHESSVVLRAYLAEALTRTGQVARSKEAWDFVLFGKPEMPEEALILAAATLKSGRPEALGRAKEMTGLAATRVNQFIPTQQRELLLIGLVGNVLENGDIDATREFLAQANGIDAVTDWARAVHAILNEAKPGGTLPVISPLDTPNP